MNALLTIQVRVASQQAMQQLQQINSGVAGIAKTAKTANAGSAFSKMFNMTDMEKFGKNLQWTGRQLEYNFTLPIVLAGAAATKFALDNEKAMTTIRKAYGAGEDAVGSLNEELKALSKTMELLSDRFGVQQSEVLQIAADWAQAGAAGVALAKATRLTLETMTLGQESASQATEDLMTIQGAYRLNTDQLRKALVTLNAVQVTTAIEFSGLVDAVARSGGAAREAGIDIEHLAAMAASLVPATGSASAAGNALRTMISRILAPTKQAADELKLMGINVTDASWQALNGVQRFEKLGVAWQGLTQAQKALVSSTIASRWQINRFDVLMDDITSTTGVYRKALDNTSDATKAQTLYAKQLSTVLASTPKGFQILWTTIQNGLARAIAPLLPAFAAMLSYVARAIDWFSRLNPEIQHTVFFFLAMLAVFGPLIKYLGAFITLYSKLGGLASLAELILDPWVLIAAAIVAAVIIFRKQVGGAIDYVERKYGSLPRFIGQVMIEVVRVIATAMKSVIHWLSYLNPFARHSPSLVDNVTRGIATILDQYSKLRNVPSVIRAAAAALDQFNSATNAGQQGLQASKYGQERADIIAVSPGAGSAIDNLINQIYNMQSALSGVNDELTQQQRLVDDMQRQVDQDMKPMTDAIFANEEAQKRLRLQILQLEQAGQSVDDLKSKFAALQGEIEGLQGQRTTLRQAGAGSDVLGVYDQQIQGLQQQQTELQTTTSQIDDLQKQLDELRRTGEMLDLQKDLQFDPQLKALDEQRDRLGQLQDAYSGIQDTIDNMAQALNGMASDARSMLSDAASSQFAAAAAGDFPVPGGDTIPGLGREGGLPEIQDFNAQLQQELDDALKGMGKMDFFKPIRDMWDKAWKWVQDNVGPYVKPVIDSVMSWFGNIDWYNLFHIEGFKTAWDGISNVIDQSGIGGVLFAVGGYFSQAGSIIFGFLDDLSKKAGPVLKTVGSWISDFGGRLGSEIANWGPTLSKIPEAIGHIFAVILPIVKVGLEAFLLGWKVTLELVKGLWDTFWPAIRDVAEPILSGLVDFIRGTLEIMRGVINLFLDLINGDWGKAWDDVKTIFQGVWDTIVAIIATPVKTIWGIIKGIVEAIVGFFKWLWDELVGHSIIPDMMNAILYWFNFIIDPIKTVFQIIGAAISFAWTNVIKPVFDAIGAGMAAVGWAMAVVKNNVIKPVWDEIVKIVGSAWNVMAGILEAGANFFIRVFNLLADAINAVAGAVGIGIHVATQGYISMPRIDTSGGGSPTSNGNFRAVAQGGMIPFMNIANAGFTAKSPTAIVGEGSRTFPEFIIPTDPRHRSNALKLYQQLGGKLAGVGDVISGGGNIVRYGTDIVGGLIANGIDVAKQFWNAVNSSAGFMGKIGVGMLSSVAGWMRGMVVDWGRRQLGTLASRIISGGGAATIAQALANRPTAGGSVGRIKAVALGGTIPSFGAGGIVYPSPGGTIIRAGERGHAEMIMPYDSSMMHGDTYHFYGNLEFPGVKNGDDASRFLKNLKTLART